MNEYSLGKYNHDQLNHEMSRGEFVKRSGLMAAGWLLMRENLDWDSAKLKIKAVAFDGFALFDPRPLYGRIKELFPGAGDRINELWKAKQFSYQWLRVSAGKYKNFLDVSMDALDFSVASCGYTFTADHRNAVLQQYERLIIWPDVIPVLQKLRGQKVKTSILSNMTAGMLERAIDNSGIAGLLDEVISTDEKKTYKPSPEAYQMPVDKLRCSRDEILFVPFAAWDMAGAKWYGYPVFWLNRAGGVADKLDAVPDGTGKTLAGLMEYVDKYEDR